MKQVASIFLIAFSLLLVAHTNSKAQQDPAYILKKKTPGGFVYKSDTRPFEKRPQNDAAMKQKWGEHHDQMVLIHPRDSSLKPFYIDAFEATVSNNRAWSVPGQIPTDRLRFQNAKDMCHAAGKRICNTLEWQTACRGGHTRPVEFKNPVQLMESCDFARTKGYDQQDYVNKTDSHPACVISSQPLYHMIGNVAEFTQNQNGQIEVVGLTYYDAHITNKKSALKRACEQVVHPNGRYPATQYNKGTGFRCCRNAL